VLDYETSYHSNPIYITQGKHFVTNSDYDNYEQLSCVIDGTVTIAMVSPAYN
jgi:hypothetical protein